MYYNDSTWPRGTSSPWRETGPVCNGNRLHNGIEWFCHLDRVGSTEFPLILFTFKVCILATVVLLGSRSHSCKISPLNVTMDSKLFADSESRDHVIFVLKILSNPMKFGNLIVTAAVWKIIHYWGLTLRHTNSAITFQGSLRSIEIVCVRIGTCA